MSLADAWRVWKNHWRTLFIVVYPLSLLPIFLLNDEPHFRCLYMIALMVGLFLTEALPPQITSLIPQVLLPAMNIASPDRTAMEYMNETMLTFFVAFTLSTAAVQSKLNYRIALKTLRQWLKYGCGVKKLHAGICVSSMIFSYFISHTVTTAMMIPITYEILIILEENGIGEVYEVLEDNLTNVDQRKPTKQTICFFLSLAYSASVGGGATIMQNEISQKFFAKYKQNFPSEKFEFWKHVVLSVPFKTTNLLATILWMQFSFLGLMRPASKSADILRINEDELESLKIDLRQRIEQSGTNFGQVVVIIFIAAVGILWVTRTPDIFPGWLDVINREVGLASSGTLLIIALFMMPSSPKCLRSFSSDEERKPKNNSSCIIDWKTVRNKLPWSFMFLVGGGFDIILGIKMSNLNQYLYEHLDQTRTFTRFNLLMFILTVITVSTQFVSNLAIVDFFYPVLSDYAKKLHVNPIYFWLPGAVACQFGFCLPVSSSPNAQVSLFCNMPTWIMFWNGIVVTALSFFVCVSILPIGISLLWNLDYE